MAANTDSDVAQLHDSCGVVAACLIDPLSLLLNKLLGIKDDEANSIGFYYETDIQGVRTTNVLLFNIYDNHPVPWLKLGCTMNKLISSSFVHKITFHPLSNSNTPVTASLLSRLTLGRMGQVSPAKFNDKFRTLIIETISNNARALHDKSRVYTLLFQRAVGITDNESLITGYNLVNRVLAILSGHKPQEGTGLISYSILKKSISIVSNTALRVADDHVLRETRQELTILMAVFIDLLTSSVSFCQGVRNKDIRSVNIDLYDLLRCEEQLVTGIVSSVQAGLLSNVTLNDYIKQLVKQRMLLGNYEPLTMSIRPAATVQISHQEVMCSFQQPPLNNVNSLRDLGAYLSHLVQTFNCTDTMTVNLGGIVSAYNLAVENTTLPAVILPTNGAKHTLSRNAIITIPGDPTVSTIVIPNHDIVIPIYDANLTILTESQLIAALVYIDSLRAPDGSSDTRFSQIQNEIVQELARRGQIN